MVGAVGIELKATLKTRKLLIPLNAKNAKNIIFAQLRYTAGTRSRTLERLLRPAESCAPNSYWVRRDDFCSSSCRNVRPTFPGISSTFTYSVVPLKVHAG